MEKMQENNSFAHIIDGRSIAKEKLEAIKVTIEQRIALGFDAPCLATILVGKDPASRVYVHHKLRACEKVGIMAKAYEFDEAVSQASLLAFLKELNKNRMVSGILVQLPLPAQISETQVIECIDPKKDVDGFHPYNQGRLAQRKPLLRPCTPSGVMQLIESTGIKTQGKHAVIVGASNIVGRPMALELLMADCTVTICHSSTENLASHVREADILVSAVGKPNLIQGSFIKKGAVVIDVGITRRPDGSLTGDVDFEQAKKIAGFITPVPGGVGPMTVASLMQNTLLSATLLD
jgi:methylenetetrahydrofolate dehydrogenase (NADP+) / methenyltetrahydrofolate cyclohydrolase